MMGVDCNFDVLVSTLFKLNLYMTISTQLSLNYVNHVNYIYTRMLLNMTHDLLQSTLISLVLSKVSK